MGDIQLNDADEAILEELQGGRVTAAYLEQQIPWGRAYITQRLRRLEEHDILTNLADTGLYQLKQSQDD
jgi:GTP-sensing pleiotropic transcriptional regulator CodY